MLKDQTYEKIRTLAFPIPNTRNRRKSRTISGAHSGALGCTAGRPPKHLEDLALANLLVGTL